MRTDFAGYYSPTTADYKRLWDDALVILDANALLNFYRWPTNAREDFFRVLEIIKDRLWIPHQVALEFQRNRVAVIASARKSTDDARSTAGQLVESFKTKVEGLQLDKRRLNIEAPSMLAEFATAGEKILAAIRTAHEAQQDISASDSVRERLDTLLHGKIGPAPSSQADLDALIATGEERFANKIPPGYADTEKERNQGDAAFIFDHIKYPRKFGDLILWKQILRHCGDLQHKVVLLITDDNKEDWWWREQGKTLGPHPELVREIMRESGVELFWMYSSGQFIENANSYIAADVSTVSVAEIKEVARAKTSYQIDITKWKDRMLHANPISRSISMPRFMRKHSELAAIGDWLAEFNDSISAPIDFPDFVVMDGGAAHGYEIKRFSEIVRRSGDFPVAYNLRRGLHEVTQGRLSAFSLIIVIPWREYTAIIAAEEINLITAWIKSLLRQHPVTAIYVGAVDGNKEFSVLIHEVGDDTEEFEQN